MATDLALAAEQVAMQAMYGYPVAAQSATAQHTSPPPTHVYSDLPREWPMARLCISYKQVNRYIRTVVWRRVAEQGLRGSYFGRIPDEVQADSIGDLLRISNALAVPLATVGAGSSSSTARPNDRNLPLPPQRTKYAGRP